MSDRKLSLTEAAAGFWGAFVIGGVLLWGAVATVAGEIASGALRMADDALYPGCSRHIRIYDPDCIDCREKART